MANTMNLQTTIDEIASNAGLDASIAERAVGILLSVIKQDVDPKLSAQLFAKLPGASDLANANLVSASSGGFLGNLAGSVLGEKAGIAASGFSQLQATGLSIAQIEQAGEKLLAYVKANAGANLASKVAANIPGL